MKILVLADNLPYPLAHGQNLRLYHYVRTLCHRHTFDLLCFGEGDAPDPLKAIFRHIEILPFAPATGQRGLVASLSVTQMLPEDPRVTARIRDLQDKEGYDLIWIAGERMVPSVPYGGASATLVDLVDDVVLMLLREARAASALGRRLRAFKRAAMNYLFERRYYGRADACLVVAEPDADMFARICPRVPVRVVRNGVDAEYYAPLEVEPEPGLIVFEGNMSFPPNVDGVVYFAQTVLPKIQAQVPAARFLVVGKDPVDEVKALASPSVEVTGFVDDVRPYIAKAQVFVCPLRKGSGIKNKVLQAWAMGKPVVATTASTGGLDARSGENIQVESLPDAFADAAARLLGEETARLTLGRAARETVVTHYSWDRKADELESLMQEAVAHHGRER